MQGNESETPYPDLGGITPDNNSVKIIAPAYASECGELNAVLQYVYHQIQLEDQGFKDYAELLHRIAVQEMRHMHILGGMLLKLGVSPIYVAYPPYPSNFYATRCISYSRLPQKIFIDDIAAEQSAIASYESMLRRLTNERVAAVIKRIKMDEEEHLAAFKNMLKDFNGKSA